MSQHEPLPDVFIFVGNTQRDPKRLSQLHSQGVASARFGKVALAIDGKSLGEEYAPLLIGRQDADRYNSVMMEKTFGAHWRTRS